MVAVTVSAPLDLITRLREKAHSMSKVFQLGAEAVLEGGLHNLKDVRKQLSQTQQLLEVKQVHNEQLIKKIARMETEVAICKEKLEEKMKDPRQSIYKDEKDIEAKYGIPAD